MSGEDTNAIQNYFRKEATVPTGGVKEFESTYFKSQPVNELNLKKELAGNVDVTCSECAENKLDCESYDELTCKHHTIKEQCNDPILNLNSKHQHQLKSSELVDLQLRETPDPNTSEVTNLPNYISIHTKVEFFVITKDGNGEHCSKGGHNVTVELRSSADHVTSLEVRDNHDGSYVALLEGKKIGEAELHVSIDGRFIMGNPYSITFRNYHAVKLPSKTVNNNGGMGKPWGIAFGRNGIWAITDYSNHCVHVFDGQDQLINSFGNRSNKTSQFINPHGIAFDESNHMYVVDNNNHRVQKFDVSGSYLLHFGSYGSDDGELQYPLGIKAHNG
ncbi:E3 ubiquitin-protein ligase TRIM71-like isoform X2 [Dysidea avara]|uniref:E3 ubiquitin-protein ligase TRIM71-like isoform X2 n=1 Tax=Dysidea avara TaxID=196820 RepID=UPI003320424A